MDRSMCKFAWQPWVCFGASTNVTIKEVFEVVSEVKEMLIQVGNRVEKIEPFIHGKQLKRKNEETATPSRKISRKGAI